MALPLRRTARFVLLAIAAFSLPLVFFARLNTPLVIDLGPGDESYARGFRSGWEYHGRYPVDETAFHWTEDGARLVLPVQLQGPLRLRLRVARFLRTPAEVTVWREGEVVGSFRQHPLGWRVRTLDVADWRGPLTLQFRTTSADGEALGIALDWVKVTGVARAWPSPAALLRIAILLLGVPSAIGWLSRSAAAGGWAAAGLSVLGAAAIFVDRLGGLMTLVSAAIPALAVVALAGSLGRWVSHRCPDLLDRRAGFVPLGAVVLALVALSHPRFYYPDVDTHAKLVAAFDEHPSLALDLRPYQATTGAWTRGIAGQRVPFPYSPAFHLLAWPIAKAIGPAAAIKTLAALALGFTLLMAYALARAVGLAREWSVAAQIVVCLLPVTASRLTLALYPTLLAQALELLALILLMRALPLESTRDTLAVGLLLAAVQAAYTGSLLSVPVIVAAVALSELWQRRSSSAVRLLGGWALGACVVVAIQYRHFVPVLWRDVLPHVSVVPAGDAQPAVAALAALRRLTIFFDHVHPGLALLGVFALREATPGRRVWRAALAAGTTLFVLRYLWPALFRDAKEVELLAAPVAVAMAAAWSWLWPRPWGRAVAIASASWVAVWGLWQAAALYAERLVAIGR